jgi:ABC-2 type transport system permease protein
MVGLFVRLKLRLLAGGFRGNRARRVSMVAGAFVGLTLALGAAALLALLPDRYVVRLCVLLYTAMLICWALLPLITFTSDETLDPARLALLPLRPWQLIRGLYAAAFVGVPAVATAVVLAGSAIGLARAGGGPFSGPVAVLAAGLELCLCVATARALASALSRLLRSRRGRDLAVFVGIGLAAGFQGVNLGSQWLARTHHAGALRSVVDLLRWTPPGALAHAPRDPLPGAVLVLVAEAGLLVLVLAWWRHTLAASMVTADASTTRVRRRETGLFRLLPGGRTGAVARRELWYSWREPRRKVGWVSVVVFGALVPFLAGYASDPSGQLPRGVMVYLVCFAALLAGLQTSANQLGLEGEAAWTDVVATRGPADVRADFAGRNLACAVIAVPALALVTAGLGAMARAPLDALTAFGLACAMLGVAIGAGNLTSVLLPYPVPDRSTSSFGGPGAGQGCLVGLSSLLSMIAVVVACLPVLALVASLRLAYPPAALLALLAGPAYGLLGAWLGRRIAGARLAARLPELYALASRPAA